MRLTRRWTQILLPVALLAGRAAGPGPLAAQSRGTADQQAFGQVAYRSPDYRSLGLAVKAIHQRTEDGQIADLPKHLQWLLDQDEDSYVWDDATQRLRPLSRLIQERVRSLPPRALEDYQDVYGPLAAREWAAARQSGEPRDFQRVVRRFFYTPAGFAAADWLATYWLDRGWHGLAARMWTRLLGEPIHTNRVTAATLVKAGIAFRLSDQSDMAAEVGRRLNSRPIALGGALENPQTWMSRVTRGLTARDWGDWPVMLGAATRNAAVSGSAPLLQSRWREPLARREYDALETDIERWKKTQRDSDSPVAVANYPVIVEGVLVFRDFAGIRARDIATGRPRWAYRCESSLAEAFAAAASRETARRRGAAAGAPLMNVGSVYAGNALQGMLAADRKRVYAVDSLEISEPFNRRFNIFRGRRRPPERLVTAETNRLLALPLRAGDRPVEPIWAVGGDDPSLSADPALAGAFFLGPPLPAEGRLFAIAEIKRQLNLVALDPATGQQLWSQGIGIVERDIAFDRDRAYLPCSPTYSRGVVVCPTQLGILVAVDASSGDLEWSHLYREDVSRKTQHTAGRVRGHMGFPNLPQVVGRSLVYLPAQSDWIHCIDLFNGKLRWKVARDDAEYIGVVTPETVFVVGRTACRGLALDDGRERWRRELGLPSGRGVAVGSQYLVPLDEGRVATLSIANGRESGHTLAAGDVKPGNLIAYDDLVISINSQSVAALPQSEVLLERVESQLAGGEATPGRQVLAAELNLILGRLERGKTLLREGLEQSLPDERRRRAEQLLRETLYLELVENRSDADAILAELAVLSREPRQRGRYLIRESSQRLRQGRLEPLTRSLGELAALDLEEPLDVPGSATYRVSPGAWVRRLLVESQRSAAAVSGKQLESLIEDAREMALETNDAARLRHFLDAYPEAPGTQEVRFRLAEGKAAEGEFEAAELLLLRNRRSDAPSIAGRSVRQLAELYDRAGRHHDAARLLVELNQEFPDVPVDGLRTGRRYLAEFPRDGLTWLAFERLQPVDWNVRRVRVGAVRQPRLTLPSQPFSGNPANWAESGLHYRSLYRKYRRRLFPPADSSLEYLIKGTEGETHVCMIDREAGVIVDTIPISPRYEEPKRSSVFVGHFLPMGAVGEVMGISSLHLGMGRPLWRASPPEIANRNTPAKLGPAGPNFCVFQARQHLLVLDPADGSILWQRGDLTTGSGATVDVYLGLFGDEQALVVFEKDRKSYTVYDTLTGAVIRRGELDVDVRKPRWAFGRRVFYVTDSATDRRVRIWDPLDNELLLDEPADPRVFATVADNDQLVLVTRPGRVRIIDVAASRIELDLQVDPGELDNLNLVRAFSDHRHIYLNFQRKTQVLSSPNSHNYSDTYLPALHLRDDVYAVDRLSGEIVWRRRVLPRSVVRLDDFRLPFLVLLGKMRPQHTDQQTTLVEVLDADSGLTIGYNHDLFPDRIVQKSYDRNRGRLSLYGQRSEIELRFDAATQRLAAPADSSFAARPRRHGKLLSD